jgi:hypothetical protein
MIFLTSCANFLYPPDTSYKYKIELLDSTLIAKGDTSLFFKDDKISIAFALGKSAIYLKMINQTKEPLKIIWDNVSIVQYNNANKVMHSGVKYTDANSSQPPTLIPPNAIISDQIIPSNNIRYVQGYYSQYSSISPRWDEGRLFTIDGSDKGQIISLFFPLEYKGVLKNYDFKFMVY